MLLGPAFLLAGSVSVPNGFSTCPPKAHQARIGAYHRYEQLFLGQHKAALGGTPRPYPVRRAAP